MIYLDNAATSWPKPDTVYQAVDHCLRHGAANPGRGGHRQALAAGQTVYDTREALAELFNIDDPNRIAFTLNATEALNMALLGYLRAGDRVVTTSMEHNAVARPLRQLAEQGVQLVVVPCDATGTLSLAALEQAVTPGTKLLVIGHASNVTGTVVPLGDIGRMADRRGVPLLVDAAQTAGAEAIDVVDMHIAMLAFPGHKGLLGPQGTGGLYVREDITLAPLICGGTGSNSESDRQPDFLPDRLESGTLNTPGIAGLGAGVRFILETGLDAVRQREVGLTAQLLAGLREIPRVVVYGHGDASGRTAVVSFNIGERDSAQVAYELDRDFGIACRAGLHCAPWAHRTLGTIRQGTVRFSPGYFTAADEVAEAVTAVRRLAAAGASA